MFYLQLLICAFWFFLSCALTLPIAVIRWRNPSNGYICAQLFTKGVKLVTGLKVKIHNEERLLSTQPCIYIGNHQNNLDIFIHACTYRTRTIAIGKKEIAWIPIFGFLFYLSRNILLDRKNHDKAVKGLNLAQDYLTRQNISIYMFPEGTRNKGATQLLPFKKGAFHMAITAGVPLLPIIASRIDDLVDFKAKKIKNGTINIEVLEPIPTKDFTVDTMDQLIALTRERMQEAFDKSKTDLG